MVKKTIAVLALMLPGCDAGLSCVGYDVACYKAALLSRCLDGARGATDSDYSESVSACQKMSESIGFGPQ